MVTMDMAIRVQNLDEAVGRLRSTNTLGIGVNPIILLPVMVKLQGILGSLFSVWQPV